MRNISQPKLWLVNITIFLFVSLYCFMFPLIADDLVRCNIAALSNHTFWSQLHWDYLNWTGRISAQALIYIFLNTQSFNAISIPIASIITGICFVVFIRLSYILLFWEQPQDAHLARYIILTLLVLFYLNPIHSYTETLGFKTIVVQYFWGTVLIWYILYKFPIQKTPPQTGIVKLLGFFILGLLLGNYNEIIAAATILYLLANFALNSLPKHNYIESFRKNRIPSSFLIGNIIGFIILIVAPGNYVRQTFSMQQTNTLASHFSIWDKVHILLHRYYQIPTKALLSLLVILFFALAMYFIISSKQKETFKKQIHFWLKLILGFIITLLMLTPIAYYFPGAIAKRITFIPDMLLFYTLFSLVIFNAGFICQKYGLHCSKVKISWLIPFIIMLGYFASFLTGAYAAYQFNEGRVYEIQHTANAENKDFTFTAMCPTSITNFFGRGLIGSQIGPDPQNVFNINYAHYYGAKSVNEVPCAK